MQNYAKRCKIKRNLAKLFKAMRKCVKLRETKQNYAKLCKTMRNLAKLRETQRKYSKLCETIPKLGGRTKNTAFFFKKESSFASQCVKQLGENGNLIFPTRFFFILL